MRGEYLDRESYLKLLQGSPPHAWRIQLHLRYSLVNTGITSTCVENTVTPVLSSVIAKDHLHMRGEYV